MQKKTHSSKSLQWLTGPALVLFWLRSGPAPDLSRIRLQTGLIMSVLLCTLTSPLYAPPPSAPPTSSYLRFTPTTLTHTHTQIHPTSDKHTNTQTHTHIHTCIHFHITSRTGPQPIELQCFTRQPSSLLYSPLLSSTLPPFSRRQRKLPTLAEVSLEFSHLISLITQCVPPGTSCALLLCLSQSC